MTDTGYVVGLDVQVAQRAYPYLIAAGVDPVEALPGEPDERWVARALSHGAACLVSPDKGVGRRAGRAGVFFLLLPTQEADKPSWLRGKVLGWAEQAEWLLWHLWALCLTGPVGPRRLEAARRRALPEHHHGQDRPRGAIMSSLFPKDTHAHRVATQRMLAREAKLRAEKSALELAGGRRLGARVLRTAELAVLRAHVMGAMGELAYWDAVDAEVKK